MSLSFEDQLRKSFEILKEDQGLTVDKLQGEDHQILLMFLGAKDAKEGKSRLIERLDDFEATVYKRAFLNSLAIKYERRGNLSERRKWAMSSVDDDGAPLLGRECSSEMTVYRWEKRFTELLITNLVEVKSTSEVASNDELVPATTEPVSVPDDATEIEPLPVLPALASPTVNDVEPSDYRTFLERVIDRCKRFEDRIKPWHMAAVIIPLLVIVWWLVVGSLLQNRVPAIPGANGRRSFTMATRPSYPVMDSVIDRPGLLYGGDERAFVTCRNMIGGSWSAWFAAKSGQSYECRVLIANDINPALANDKAGQLQNVRLHVKLKSAAVPGGHTAYVIGYLSADNVPAINTFCFFTTEGMVGLSLAYQPNSAKLMTGNLPAQPVPETYSGSTVTKGITAPSGALLHSGSLDGVTGSQVGYVTFIISVG